MANLTTSAMAGTAISLHLENEAARAELPAGRAFVVQLSADSTPGEGQFVGRIEHVSSGQRVHFDSLNELAEFISHAIVANGRGR